MSDIRLNVTGDAGGGVAAMDSMSDAAGRSAVKWQEMANAAKFAAKAVIDFAVESVKKYAESERVLSQLKRASGEYADAINEQSQALSKLYAVDDDLINQSATLLAQWGGAAAASKDAEVAALNLAAAMGTDLNTATQTLIKNVESGGVGLAKMGIHFEATGNRGKDFAAMVAAVNGKLGGAAAANADTLTGNVHAASLAFEDLQKTFGGFVSALLQRSGALAAVTGIMRDMQLGAEVLGRAFDRLPAFLGEAIKGKGFATAALIKEANSLIDDTLHPKSPMALPDMLGGTTNAGGKEAGRESARAAKEAAKEASDVRREMAAADAQDQKDFQRAELDAQDEYAKESVKIEKARVKEIQETQEEINKWLAGVNKEEAAAELKSQKDAAKEEDKALKDQAQRVEKKAKEAQAAGDAIGAAMVNALTDQLAKLAEGGEFDAAMFMTEILAVAVAAAGTVIGSAFGQPAVGAAVGNLAAMGVRAGGSAISRGAKKANTVKQYHSGGWVGDEPRYHSGAWIGADEQRAILQTGERVLARDEVRAMGGPRGVDAAARGGAGLTLNITAIDTKSVADTFSGRGADGLRQALRSGRGALPALLGRGPR